MAFQGYARKAAKAKRKATKCTDVRAQPLWLEIADFWRRLDDDLNNTQTAKTRSKARRKSHTWQEAR